MRIIPVAVKSGSLVVIAALLLACQPHPVHLSGTVSLEYVGASASGVEFILKNGSAKTISFRGQYAKHKSADARDTQVDCRAANGTTRYEHPMEVGADEPGTIEVPPGQEMRLLLWSDFMTLSRGAHCHVNLRLEDHTKIESAEFVP